MDGRCLGNGIYWYRIDSQNAEIVRTTYSVADSGRRLMEIYEQIESSDRDDEMKQLEHGNRILERFLSLPRFHQLRVES